MSDDVTRVLCNAVEPVPGPLPGRCALPPHANDDHDWTPGAEVRNRTRLAQAALATATAEAISATRTAARMATAAGASDRLPTRGVA